MSEKSDVTMEMTEPPEEKHLNPDTDTKPDNNKTTPLNYLRGLLTDSVVTGVPQIVTVGNILRKIFKTVILFACLAGFIYQTVDFMNLYHSYPSSLEIDISHGDNFPFPAVTICNINGIKRSEFCKDFPEKCSTTKNLENFCKMYPRYCTEDINVNNLTFVKTTIYSDERDYLFKYGQKAEELINDCCITVNSLKDQCIKKADTRIFSSEFKMEKICYTVDFSKLRLSELNSNDTLNNLINFYSDCFFWSSLADKSETLILNLDPNEYIVPGVIPAAQIVVHSSNDLVNPFIKGFTAEVGKRYTVRLSAYEEHLLPAPFATKCIENSQLPKNYSQSRCIDQCKTYIVLEKCECISPESTLTFDFPECFKNKETIACLLSTNYEECYNKCPKQCHTFYFTHDIVESGLESGVNAVNLGNGPVIDEITGIVGDLLRSKSYNMDGKTIINILYSKNEVTKYIYKPKYDKIEILGYIGGFSGIWLGISLVAVFDFFETIGVFIFYLCGRRYKKS